MRHPEYHTKSSARAFTVKKPVCLTPTCRQPFLETCAFCNPLTSKTSIVHLPMQTTSIEFRQVSPDVFRLDLQCSTLP